MSPPATWRPWHRPSLALRIDEAISDLLRRKRNPKLRSDAKEIFECPYWYARLMTAIAIDMANRGASQTDAVRARRAKEWMDLAKKATSLCKELNRTFAFPKGKIRFGAERWPSETPLSITSAYNDIAQAVEALSRVEQYARARRALLVNNQGNIWRLTFAATLGFAWRGLTGINLANSRPCIDFVTAAWESLAENADSIAWDRYVRRALDLYDDWDRYDPEVIEEQSISQSIFWPPVGKTD